MPDLYDLYDLYDLAHVAGWKPYNLHDLQYIMCRGLDLYCTDPAHHLLTARKDLPVDYLVRDLYLQQYLQQDMFPGLDLYYTELYYTDPAQHMAVG